MSDKYTTYEVDVDETVEMVMNGVRRGYVHEDRQLIIKLLKAEAEIAYAAGDDDDFADGIKHAYMLIEKMEEQ